VRVGIRIYKRGRNLTVSGREVGVEIGGVGRRGRYIGRRSYSREVGRVRNIGIRARLDYCRFYRVILGSRSYTPPYSRTGEARTIASI